MGLCRIYLVCFFFFFKQKTAYEMRISDWSSDVCSSDLGTSERSGTPLMTSETLSRIRPPSAMVWPLRIATVLEMRRWRIVGESIPELVVGTTSLTSCSRSEEHTSELQSLMRISYAVFCLKNTTARI